MKQIGKAAIVAALAVLVASCGGQPSDQSADGSGNESAPPAADAGASAAETGEAAVAAAAPPASFMQCRSCHAVEPGKHGVGPSLVGVFGTKAGEIPGYTFSDAMKSSGLTWDEATLDKWLESPAKLVPGTKMIYPGMPDPAKRREVIDYMKSLK